MTSFFDYEKENNSLLNAIKDKYKDLIKVISTNEVWRHISHHIIADSRQKAGIFVPQSVSLEPIEISRDLVETHLFISNPSQPFQFVTLNGVLGTYNSKRTTLSIISPPQTLSSGPQQFDPLADSPQSLFTTKKWVHPITDEVFRRRSRIVWFMIMNWCRDIHVMIFTHRRSVFDSYNKDNAAHPIHVLREGSIKFDDKVC